MPEFNPVSLRIVDNHGTELVNSAVPFEPNMSARQVLERAFILAQTPANPDPFVFTLQYYGYSEAAPFPGYLGYEIESFGTKQTGNLPNNAQFYWDLIVDGVSSSSGADTSYPNPGGTVLWQYTPVPAAPAAPSKRLTLVQRRRQP